MGDVEAKQDEQTLVTAASREKVEQYQGDMIAGSASKTAAVAGDQAAAASAATTGVGVQHIDFDLDHAMKRSEYFRKVAMGYGKGESAERSHVVNKQAEYAIDASNLSRASLHYNTLTPQAQFAAQSRARLDAIRSSLPDYVDLENGADGHSKGLKKGVERGDLDSGGGKVTSAANEFNDTRMELMDAASAMQALATGALVEALEERLTAAKDAKGAIESRINKVVGFIDAVGSIAGTAGAAGGKAKAKGGTGEVYSKKGKVIGTTSDPGTLETGDQSAGASTETAGGEVASGGNVVSQVVSFGLQLFNAHDLERLENEIRSLSSTKEIWKSVERQEQAVTIRGQFVTAKSKHLHATQEYLMAIASRRKDYAMAGKAAAVAEAGASGAKRADPLAQYLLVASAYQEHAQIVRTTLATAQYARDTVKHAWSHMQHRLGDYQLSDLSVRKDEGLKATDAVQIKSAWLATSELVTTLDDEQGFVDRESTSAQNVMAKSENGNAQKGY